MKKILQALDTASSKPVEGSNDMKKFVSIVNEGANPHKVALPVQMAMQHYQQEKKVIPSKKNSVINQYFQEAEEMLQQKQTERKQLLQQYAQKVSHRVLENSRNRDAYQRDYDSSVSGFGRRERDMDDESNLLYIYRDGRLKQSMISNRNEKEARAQGFRDTQEQALRLHGIIRSKFDSNKWVQKQGTGWVQVFPFGNPNSN